jgi:hypothetical protein
MPFVLTLFFVFFMSRPNNDGIIRKGMELWKKSLAKGLSMIWKSWNVMRKGLIELKKGWEGKYRKRSETDRAIRCQNEYNVERAAEQFDVYRLSGPVFHGGLNRPTPRR